MEIDYSLIGRRVAAIRKARGLKQREVCEMADINDKYLSIIEHAHSIPSLEVLMRLCIALDVTPNDLLLDCGASTHKNNADQLAQKIAALTSEQFALLSDLVDCISIRNMSKQKEPNV